MTQSTILQMSCVCIVLFACQNAFRAREPLPQFLPSPRHAFVNLETHVQDCIRLAREEDEHAMGLSLVYAFAEQEVMKNMVDTLEELLDTTGSLFGTSTWLTHDSRWSRITVNEEGDHGWYSTFKWDESQLLRPDLQCLRRRLCLCQRPHQCLHRWQLPRVLLILPQFWRHSRVSLL